MNLRLLIILTGALLLSSCAVFQEEFSCSSVSGKSGCHSLDEISQSVKNGSFKTNSTTPTTKNRQASLGYPSATPKAGDPVRFGDCIQKVTVFPYEDSEGHYHDISQVFMVVKHSHWIGKPLGAKDGKD